MTDEQIIEMLEKEAIGDMYRECSSCDYYKSIWCDGEDGICKERFAINVLDLIRRQQTKIERLERVKETDNEIIASLEAEIDRQQAEIEELKEFSTARFDKFATEYDWNIRAEAIKEFADRLKSKTFQMSEYDEGGWGCAICVVRTEDIDNTIEEMGCGND